MVTYVKIPRRRDFDAFMRYLEKDGYTWGGGQRPTKFDPYGIRGAVRTIELHSGALMTWSEDNHPDAITISEFKRSASKALLFRSGEKLRLAKGGLGAKVGSTAQATADCYAGDTYVQVKWLDTLQTDGFRQMDGAYYPDYFERIKEQKERTVGRRTFKLLKDTPDIKKGALFQEACDDGDQEYVLLSKDHFKFDDQDEYFDDEHAPAYTRKEVEQNPKWFVEVFPATESYLTKEELAAFKIFMKQR